MTLTELEQVWDRIRGRVLGMYRTPTAVEQAAGLVFGQGLSLLAAVHVCNDMGGSYWASVAYELETVLATENGSLRAAGRSGR